MRFLSLKCTRSSVGRASVSEAEGRWFEPSRVRQNIKNSNLHWLNVSPIFYVYAV